MSNKPDLLFLTEYIKDTLYFAVARHSSDLKSTQSIHYYCIDDDLVYKNFFTDFGPLNLGCLYIYCKQINKMLRGFAGKKRITHYTSTDPRKKANAAFLMGCYGVIYMGLSPKEALKPLILNQSYLPFQDASQEITTITISLLDCLSAIHKARQFNFFNFHDFDYEEYSRVDNCKGCDLNWIVPQKFLAFLGPVQEFSYYPHPPELYVRYFQENNVGVVVRLNKRVYDKNVFLKAGIVHYDLYFPDGTTPPRNIFLKFMTIAEQTQNTAIAVHCKAGLGRTGTLIGSYIIKHYEMTAHEAIAWMRICRPGSVIGLQQTYLERMEGFLLKQGKIYRKKVHRDSDCFPMHNYGVYSLVQKSMKNQRYYLSDSPSPLPPMVKQNIDIGQNVRPKASKVREAHCAPRNESPVRSGKTLTKVTQISINIDPIFEKLSNFNRGDIEARFPVARPRESIQKTPTRSQIKTEKEIIKKNANVGPEYKQTPMSFLPSNTFALITNIDEAKAFLMKSSSRDTRENISKPRAVSPTRSNQLNRERLRTTKSPQMPSPPPLSSRTGGQRCRLGRSPSPPTQSREKIDKIDMSNSCNSDRKTMAANNSIKSEVKALLTRQPRISSYGASSVGAASLDAPRLAPAPPQTASVRSDNRTNATQGDLLNSIKFERILRESMQMEKKKSSNISKDKSSNNSTNEKNKVPPKNSCTKVKARCTPEPRHQQQTGSRQGTQSQHHGRYNTLSKGSYYSPAY